MSHFLKQKINTFSNIDSLRTALEAVAKRPNSVHGAGPVTIYGSRTQQADLVCTKSGFGTMYNFGYVQGNNEVNCVCDSMDRHKIERLEQEAKQHYIAAEVTTELGKMGFSQENQTTEQGKLQLTFARWR